MFLHAVDFDDIAVNKRRLHIDSECVGFLSDTMSKRHVTKSEPAIYGTGGHVNPPFTTPRLIRTDLK